MEHDCLDSSLEVYNNIICIAHIDNIEAMQINYMLRLKQHIIGVFIAKDFFIK